MRFIAAIILTVLLLPGKTSAQDIHFSQYYAMPVFHNPAFTGFFNGDVRVAGDFRMQWETFGAGFGNAYRTAALAADFGFLRPKTGGSTLGVGATFVNDRAGDTKLSMNQAGLALSYVQALDRSATNFLGLGFHGTFNQRSIDLTEAVFPDQVETDILGNYTYFDLSAGLLWFFEPNDAVNFYIAGAVHNLLTPNVSFYEGQTEELDRRITGQFGSKFDVSRRVSLIPSVLYQKQGPSQEVVFGTFLQLNLGGYSVNPIDNFSLQFGAFHRLGDAIIPVLRMDMRSVTAIFSYDINLGKLTPASRGEGAAEISITYTGRIFPQTSKNKPLRCPAL